VQLRLGSTYNIIALANDLCVYPAILDDMVTSDTVNPTDWVFTSQKETSRPHLFALGRYARHPAETVQRMLAAVAVASRELGTFNVMAPPMKSATI
jgi:hypothetical protein